LDRESLDKVLSEQKFVKLEDMMSVHNSNLGY